MIPRAGISWTIALLALLAGGALLGRILGIGSGGGLFFAGAGAILASILDIRTGGVKTRVGRTRWGTPIIGQDAQKRAKELRRGLRVFALGLATWAILMVGYLLGVVR